MSKKLETYFKLLDLRQNTETNRWTRFNALLIVDGLLITVWTQIMTTSCKSMRVDYIFLPILGAVVSAIWYFLSVNTNKYHSLYNDKARKLEKELGVTIPCKICKAESEAITYSGWRKKAGTSTWISEKTPIFFTFIFIYLIILSVLKTTNM